MKDQNVSFFLLEKSMFLCLLLRGLTGALLRVTSMQLLFSLLFVHVAGGLTHSWGTVLLPKPYSKILLFIVCKMFLLRDLDSFQVVSLWHYLKWVLHM